MPEPSRPEPRARILLVEDDPAIRALFTNFLRHAGYDVLDAADGAAALTVLDADGGPVDLLVTDIVMPRAGGPALVRDARTRQPGMRVLYISGHAARAEVAAAATPDTSYVLKPLTRSALLAAVASACPPRRGGPA